MITYPRQSCDWRGIFCIEIPLTGGEVDITNAQPYNISSYIRRINIFLLHAGYPHHLTNSGLLQQSSAQYLLAWHLETICGVTGIDRIFASGGLQRSPRSYIPASRPCSPHRCSERHPPANRVRIMRFAVIIIVEHLFHILH